MEDKNQDISKLLEGFVSPEGREYFSKRINEIQKKQRVRNVIDALREGKKIDSALAEEAISFLEDKDNVESYSYLVDNLRYAARIAENQDMYDEAIELYRRAGLYRDSLVKAREIASKAGMDELAKEISYDIIARSKEKGFFADAASEAKILGLEEKAREYALKAASKMMGSEHRSLSKPVNPEFAIQYGIVEEVIELYLKSYSRGESFDWFNAIELAEKAGLEERAMELRLEDIKRHERRGDYSGAGIDAERLGLNERAIELYEKDGGTYYLEKAGDIAESIGIEEKARELYSKVLQAAYKEDETETALKMAIKISDEEKISELKPAVMAKIRVKVNDKKYADAICIAEKAGLVDEVKDLAVEGLLYFEKECNFKEAAKVARCARMDDRKSFYRSIMAALKERDY